MKDNIILKHFSSWQSEIDESLVDKKIPIHIFLIKIKFHGVLTLIHE